MRFPRTIITTEGTSVLLLAVRLECPRGILNGVTSLTLWVRDAPHHRYARAPEQYAPESLDTAAMHRLVGLPA